MHIQERSIILLLWIVICIGFRCHCLEEAVGNLEAKVSVVQGQLKLTVPLPQPLEFPQWIEPLDLVYNSGGQACDITVVGKCWAIGGLSKISRCESKNCKVFASRWKP